MSSVDDWRLQIRGGPPRAPSIHSHSHSSSSTDSLPHSCAPGYRQTTLQSYEINVTESALYGKLFPVSISAHIKHLEDYLHALSPLPCVSSQDEMREKVKSIAGVSEGLVDQAEDLIEKVCSLNDETEREPLWQNLFCTTVYQSFNKEKQLSFS